MLMRSSDGCPVCNVAVPPALPADFVRDIEAMAHLHDRQPAFLAPEAYDAWLDPATPAADVQALLGRNLDDDLQFHRADRGVNASNRTDKPHDDASMVNPL